MLRQSFAINVFFVSKISVLVSITVFEKKLRHSEVFLSGLFVADTIALYTILGVKHLLSSYHSDLFVQLQAKLVGGGSCSE